MKKVTRLEKQLKSATHLKTIPLQSSFSASVKKFDKRRPRSKMSWQNFKKLSASELNEKPLPMKTHMKAAKKSTCVKSKIITEPSHEDEEIFNFDKVLDSPRSFQSEQPIDMEKEVLMEEIENLNNNISRVRLENEILKRKAKGEIVYETEEEKEKDAILEKQSKELTELHVDYGGFKLKYESMKKELQHDKKADIEKTEKR